MRKIELLNEALTDWKKYAVGYEKIDGDYKYMLNTSGFLILTVRPGKNDYEMYTWKDKLSNVQAADKVVANHPAHDKGWLKHFKWDDAVLIAEWRSKGGKYGVKLYHEGAYSYRYKGDYGSGSFDAMSHKEAIDLVQNSASTDQPSANRTKAPTKMPRVK